MKILALIPARGGSKRLPGKNIKILGGLPLIAWTIRAVHDSSCCADVLVSTDDPSIAEIARQYGANVPWLRPVELSADTSTSVDMAIHAIDSYEKENGHIDGLILLQPTSPFRSARSIKDAVDLYTKSRAQHPVVSFSPATDNPAWCFRKSADGIVPFLGWSAINRRSQDLEPAWVLNGSIYLTSPSRLRDERTFLTADTVPLFINNSIESIDIDTPEDFYNCEKILKIEEK